MKYGIISLGATALAISAAVFINRKHEPEQKAEVSKGAFEPVAVLELFTSQGCSSCPPADRLLTQTMTDAYARKQKIFALSFHVDYWNRLGWPDPFSSAAFSARQNNYVSALKINGAYTPQLIVNGTTEFTGSDRSTLSSALAKALKEKAEVNFTNLHIVYAAGKTIKVQYALEGNFTGAKINFALVSLHETTNIKRGENGGITLSNDHVVRQLLTQKAEAAGEIEFAASSVPKENLTVIAFIQQGDAGRITGAAEGIIN